MKTRLMKGKINYQINPFIRIFGRLFSWSSDSDNKKMSIYNVPKENNYKTNYT